MTELESLSYSRRKTIRACPKRFYLEYLLNLEPKEKPIGMALGSAFSDCIEHADPKQTNNHMHLTAEQRAVVHIMAKLYLSKYPKAEQRELGFYWPIEGTGYSNNGRIDGLDADDWIVEDKFLKSLFGAKVLALSLDDQITAMLYAARRLHQENPERYPYPKGCKYRATLRPRDRRTKRNPETPEQYVRWVIEDTAARPEHYLREFRETRSDAQLDRFEEELVEAAEYLDWLKARNKYPMDPDSCEKYGGCPFIGICNGSIQMDQILQHYNKKEPRK